MAQEIPIPDLWVNGVQSDTHGINGIYPHWTTSGYWSTGGFLLFRTNLPDGGYKSVIIRMDPHHRFVATWDHYTPFGPGSFSVQRTATQLLPMEHISLGPPDLQLQGFDDRLDDKYAAAVQQDGTVNTFIGIQNKHILKVNGEKRAITITTSDGHGVADCEFEIAVSECALGIAGKWLGIYESDRIFGTWEQVHELRK
eukprot:850618_1